MLNAEGGMERGLRISVKGRRLLGLLAIALLAVAVLQWKPLMVEFRTARARRALAARQNQRAVEELQAALRLAPDRPETLFLLARAHRRLGNLEGASTFLQQAKSLGGDPNRLQRETWLLLARAGRLRDAEPHLVQLLADPRDDGPDICESFVHGYVANLFADPAEQLLDAWQKDYPDDPQQYFMRAYFLERTMGKTRESVEAYRQGLSLAPNESVMRYRLALALMSLSDFEQAGEELRRCVEHDPENPEVLAALAECLRKRGELDRAADVLRQVLGIAPDLYKAHRMLGEIELSQGRPGEALGHLERAARERPYDIAVRFMLGHTLRTLGRADEAKTHLDYVARAEGPLQRVERQCRQAALRPNDFELRYEIGTGLLAYGNPEDGVTWLLSVLQLKPDHAAAHQALAGYFEAHGDRQRALHHRRQLDAQGGPSPRGKPLR